MRHWLTPNSHLWEFLSLNRQLELERMRQLALTRVLQRQESKGIKRAGETCSQYSYYLDAKDSGACQAKQIPLTHLRQPKSRIGGPKGPWLTPDPAGWGAFLSQEVAFFGAESLLFPLLLGFFLQWASISFPSTHPVLVQTMVKTRLYLRIIETFEDHNWKQRRAPPWL